MPVPWAYFEGPCLKSGSAKFLTLTVSGCPSATAPLSCYRALLVIAEVLS